MLVARDADGELVEAAHGLDPNAKYWCAGFRDKKSGLLGPCRYEWCKNDQPYEVRLRRSKSGQHVDHFYHVPPVDARGGGGGGEESDVHKNAKYLLSQIARGSGCTQVVVDARYIIQGSLRVKPDVGARFGTCVVAMEAVHKHDDDIPIKIEAYRALSVPQCWGIVGELDLKLHSSFQTPRRLPSGHQIWGGLWRKARPVEYTIYEAFGQVHGFLFIATDGQLYLARFWSKGPSAKRYCYRFMMLVGPFTPTELMMRVAGGEVYFDPGFDFSALNPAHYMPPGDWWKTLVHCEGKYGPVHAFCQHDAAFRRVQRESQLLQERLARAEAFRCGVTRHLAPMEHAFELVRRTQVKATWLVQSGLPLVDGRGKDWRPMLIEMMTEDNPTQAQRDRVGKWFADRCLRGQEPLSLAPSTGIPTG